MKADRPITATGLEYHLHTRVGNLAPWCLIVGAPGRAEMIGKKFLKNPRWFKNRKRGLVSVTGQFQGLRVSVSTSGMGVPSLGIVLPEAMRSGARCFIRVGSCGSLIKEAPPGDSIIIKAAIRFDGASTDWAPLEYPAFADPDVTLALIKAAQQVARKKFHVGVEATTSDFNTGQGRPNLWNELPPRMAERHREVIRLGAACYSMEAAGLFVWCATEGKGAPCGAVNAVYANRITNEFAVCGDEQAGEIALQAFLLLAKAERT